MPYSPGRPGLESEISGLAERRGQLQQAASLPGADLRQVLEAAFAELDGAIDALTSMGAQAAAGPGPDRQAGGLNADRRLLHAVFQEAPVPLFLLDRDGTVRRANRRAGKLRGQPCRPSSLPPGEPARAARSAAACSVPPARCPMCSISARSAWREVPTS
jgi:PAS domain-containing protein